MLIGKEVIDQENVKVVVSDIKKKKELSALDEDFILTHLQEYLRRNPKQISTIQEINTKSKNYKLLIKEVRSVLRRLYGLFRSDAKGNERKKLVEQFCEEKDAKKQEQLLIKILETHASTKERLAIYSKLYEKIFEITQKPKKIMDLGCGINPFSIMFMKLEKCAYYAYDISKDEIATLQEFFNSYDKVTGKAEVLDIQHFSKLPKVDVALLLKMTDVLDRGKGHKATETVITKIPSSFVVVSFPTITMSGKKMNFPRRKWIELLCERLNYKQSRFTLGNELFYVIKK